MPGLSDEQRTFWDEQGYLVLRELVPLDLCRAAEQATWEFIVKDPDDPETWYAEMENRSIVSSMYHHQSLWDIRQHPPVHEMFSSFFGSEKLWVDINQTGMNPPERGEWTFHDRYKLHWDIPVRPPFHFYVQGMLYLTDTPADQGAFALKPGFHKKLDRWLAALPEEQWPERFAPEDIEAEPVAGKAGDLIIWNSLLPHGATPNRAKRPRMVCYLTMFPAHDDDEDRRNRRIEHWRERYAMPIMDAAAMTWEPEKGKEHHEGKTAELTPLGRKLLGLDRWE
jgi:hypothetical protein